MQHLQKYIKSGIIYDWGVLLNLDKSLVWVLVCGLSPSWAPHNRTAVRMECFSNQVSASMHSTNQSADCYNYTISDQMVLQDLTPAHPLWQSPSTACNYSPFIPSVGAAKLYVTEGGIDVMVPPGACQSKGSRCKCIIIHWSPSSNQ